MKTRTYFVTNWKTLDINGHFRAYSHIFEGSDVQKTERRARLFTQSKSRIYRACYVELIRFDETTHKEGFTDITGRYHLPECSTKATYLYR